MTAPFETSGTLANIPGVTHGFFGQRGGASTGDFAGNNMSHAVGDTGVSVDNNRAALAQQMGFQPGRLVILKQVHSARVETVSAPLGAEPAEADALVTATPGLLLGILTADCAPILFADPAAGIVGAAHAGWRGAAEGIALNTISAMVALGAERSRIRAAIGPTITGPNYEVGESFKADFLAIASQGEPHFTTPPGGKPHFDLPGFLEAQLQRAGIASVERVGTCTYASPERYFSHRYATHAGTRTGRQIAVIGLTQV